jgi:mono/diheme cytochrome c family protein
MMKSLLILLSFFSVTQVYASDIAIKIDGKASGTLKIDEIKKMRTLEIEFYNSVTKRAELYRGVSTLAIIEKFFPDSQNLVEVSFVSENGFRSYVEMDRLRSTSSILAFERADGDKFVRYSQKEKVLVPLGPLYLVWDLKGMAPQERLSHSSVYQIKSLNLETSKSEFGFKESSVDESVYLGLQSYRAHCISCHAIGSEGGDVSFDLMKRKTLQSKGGEYVAKYILNPVAMNPKTKMLPLPRYKNQALMAQGIVNFLKFMQNPEELLKKKKALERETSYKALQEIVKTMN